MTRYQNRDNAEIITVLGTEEPGWMRIALFDGTQDIISDAELADYDVITDTETEENPDDEIHQRWTSRRDRERARIAALRAQLEAAGHYGR